MLYYWESNWERCQITGIATWQIVDRKQAIVKEGWQERQKGSFRFTS